MFWNWNSGYGDRNVDKEKKLHIDICIVPENNLESEVTKWRYKKQIRNTNIDKTHEIISEIADKCRQNSKGQISQNDGNVGMQNEIHGNA
jgi:hypothetical protein